MVEGRGASRRGHGRIEVIVGGMFSGKSEELVRRLRRAAIARQRIQVFQPTADTRHDPDEVVTRDRRRVEARSVPDSAALAAAVDEDTQVIGIDEVQFFDEDLVAVVEALADGGRRVIVAGLDLDFQRQPFGPMPALLAIAEYVDKMHAVCVRCGEAAHYSQRLTGGAERVQVGDGESYEARCRDCYEEYAPRK